MRILHFIIFSSSEEAQIIICPIVLKPQICKKTKYECRQPQLCLFVISEWQSHLSSHLLLSQATWLSASKFLIQMEILATLKKNQHWNLWQRNIFTVWNAGKWSQSNPTIHGDFIDYSVEFNKKRFYPAPFLLVISCCISLCCQNCSQSYD